MARRVLVLGLTIAVLACAACGGGVARSNNADVLAMNQPTPDATLDAVVRDLPKALAGIAPTATPTPVIVPKPAIRQPVPPTATPKPAPPKPMPTPTATHH
jgi:hypothetical protein